MYKSVISFLFSFFIFSKIIRRKKKKREEKDIFFFLKTRPWTMSLSSNKIFKKPACVSTIGETLGRQAVGRNRIPSQRRKYPGLLKGQGNNNLISRGHPWEWLSVSERVSLRSTIRENILISRVLTSEVVGEAEAQSFGEVEGGQWMFQ